MPDFGDRDPEQGGRYEYQGQLDPNAPSVLNGQITPEQWAEYQSKRRRDMILGLLGVFGATTGLGAVGGAISGGAGAAGSAASGASGSLPAISGGAPWAVTPYATTATSVGTGLSGGAAGAAGASGAAGILGGMSARDLAALGLSAAGTIGGALSRPENMNATTATTDPQLQALMRTMQGRLDKSEPLYDSVMQMANGLLPTQYQKGGGGVR